MKHFKTGIGRPIEFISCGLFISEVPWTHTNRTIDSFEIIIGVIESLYISQGGVEYEVKPGEVLLLLPGEVHEGYRECAEGISFYWFHFVSGEPYELLLDEFALTEELAQLNDPNSVKTFSKVIFPLCFKPARIERVNILFQQLQHIVSSNYYTQQAANYVSTSLLIELSEQLISDYNSSKMSQGDRSITEIIEWIRIHVRNPISVSDVAEKFGYNKDYLSRFFKKKTGYNLQEYIHLLKLSKSKDLLSRSMRSIKQISDLVGFNDEKYFMRLFKKYENMTPTEYRQAYFRIHMNNQ
jgi:AraC-like DNA-binding protein